MRQVDICTTCITNLLRYSNYSLTRNLVSSVKLFYGKDVPQNGSTDMIQRVLIPVDACEFLYREIHLTEFSLMGLRT